MKKIIYIIGSILLLLYVIYIKFYISIPFISYENYHGIEFLNNIYINNYNILKYFISLFFYGGPDDGHINRVLYSFLISNFSLSTNFIFYLQSFLSVLTYLFFSLSLYFLSNKNKYLGFILFILLLISPHQIKYGLSEDYYILGNFFISISIFTFIYSLIKNKILYFLLALLLFIFSIYSRTLFLLYIPIFIILYFLIKDFKFNDFNFTSIKLYIINNLYKILIIITWIFLFLFPIIERYNKLVSQNGKFSGIGENNIFNILFSQNNLIGIIDSSVFNIYYDIFIYVGLIGALVYFIKNKFYIKLVSSILFYIYINFLFSKYINSGLGSGLRLERHILLLEPLYFIFISIGVYWVYYLLTRYLKNLYKNILYFIIILILFYLPFYEKSYILENYSYQKEFLFLNDNISKIGNNFNLIIPNNSVNKVNYEFPVYLFKNIKDFNIYLYNISIADKNKYSSFINNYNSIKDKDNIFYLSTACYSSGDNSSIFIKENGIREDCKYIVDNFHLTPILEYKIQPETYIIPYINTPLKEITIGFYRINGLKDERNN